VQDGPYVESVVRARERAMNEVPELVLTAYCVFVLSVLGGLLLG
jgi:hypothetical protein